MWAMIVQPTRWFTSCRQQMSLTPRLNPGENKPTAAPRGPPPFCRPRQVVSTLFIGEHEMEKRTLKCETCGNKDRCIVLKPPEDDDPPVEICCMRKGYPDNFNYDWNTFWYMVTVTRRKPDGCWPWCGKIIKKGYGTLIYLRKRQLAHEAAYRSAHHIKALATLPEIEQTCGNRSCCNPRHLVPKVG